MAPARILASQPQREGPHVGRRGRTSALAGRLPPLPAHERPTPAQQRPRADQTRSARGAWQLAGRRREQGTIRGAKPRTPDLPAQHLKLVAQDQKLDVPDVEATATADEHPSRARNARYRKEKATPAILPALAQTRRDTTIGALQAQTGTRDGQSCICLRPSSLLQTCCRRMLATTSTMSTHSGRSGGEASGSQSQIRPIRSLPGGARRGVCPRTYARGGDFPERWRAEQHESRDDIYGE